MRSPGRFAAVSLLGGSDELRTSSYQRCELWDMPAKALKNLPRGERRTSRRGGHGHDLLDDSGRIKPPLVDQEFVGRLHQVAQLRPDRPVRSRGYCL